jgi:hypothetical protein
MRNSNTKKQQITRYILQIACVIALGVTPAVAQSQAAGREITPPSVPDNLVVDPPHVPFLATHGVGTQNYVCLPLATGGVGFVLFTPQATLFDDELDEVTTHFFGPNPEEKGVIRVAWQHSKDTSTVWGRVKAFSFDAKFVTPGVIPWLLVEKKGTLAGPTGGDKLTKTTFIHRVNTVGGAAPATGCGSPADIGKTQFVPYQADYIFYRDPTL